jgi:hypothetical protein
MWHPITPISIKKQSHRHRLPFDNCKKNSPVRTNSEERGREVKTDRFLHFKNLKFDARSTVDGDGDLG